MNLSMKWLHDFVDIEDVTPKAFSEALTMTGSKVEGFKTEGCEISKVVVGKILSVEKHPNADKLVVCMVDVGSGEPIQIVTGATNVFAGAIVPVALDGSTLPDGMKIKKGKLRGVLSNGMLCSLGELHLTLNDFPYTIENGIFILQEDCVPGQDIREAIGLNDTVVEFEITPNRPDCLSVIGLAREVAATYGKKLTIPEPAVKGGHGKTQDFVSAEIHETNLCTRYCARAVKNVKIQPSPRWMRERLRAAGVRPINNIVDITNYVMLEYGQPMHAFDYRFISGGTIHVRLAKEGETIVTLDGEKRELDSSMLVIADDSKPVAVAGVMGGEYSGIVPDTNTIIFESAMFNGVSVRITSKKLGLRSESSARFEKGLDAQISPAALTRACELVELLGAGEVCDDPIDLDYSDHRKKTIEFDPDWINTFLGTDISPAFMKQALESLKFSVNGNRITVPTYRGDIEHKADIAEEVARLYGYDKIPVSLTLGETTQGGLNSRQKFERKISNAMLSMGLNEIMTYSFISPKYYDKISMPGQSPLRSSVKIMNPLGEDTSVMRTTLLPSMMEVLSRNYSNRNMEARLFEFGTVYFPKGENELPEEIQKISIGMYADHVDFYTVKGAVEELLAVASIEDYDVCAYTEDPAFHPGRCAVITVEGEKVAVLGEVHPTVLENYGLDVRAYAAEINLELLMKYSQPEKQYQPLPKFPAVTRDIAVICDEAVPVLTIEKAIKGAAKNVLESIELFDLYHGKQIPEGKKSAAFSIALRAQDRTLTDEEAESTMKKIIKALSGIDVYLRA